MKMGYGMFCSELGEGCKGPRTDDALCPNPQIVVVATCHSIPALPPWVHGLAVEREEGGKGREGHNALNRDAGAFLIPCMPSVVFFFFFFWPTEQVKSSIDIEGRLDPCLLDAETASYRTGMYLR